MIIDDDYIVSSFHLKSGNVLRNSLFDTDGYFNYYIIDENDDDKNIKLFKRTREKDIEGECINESLIAILHPNSIEYIELKEIEDIPEDMLEVLNIEEIKEESEVENRNSH